MAEPMDEDGRAPAQGREPTRKSALETNDDYSKYEVQSKTEILYILKTMMESGALITVYFNHGNDFLLTSLLSIAADGSTLVLDFGSNAEMNRRALESDKLTCISSQGKVKIQFVLDGVDLAKFEGRNGFLGNVPETLVRLQRRDYYRLTTPVGNPLLCHIPLEAGGAATTVAATILDISGGGVAFVVPPEIREIETDKELPNCRIDLPNVGTVIVALRVRNIHDLTLPNGRIQKRCGCQFLKLPGPMSTMIQRYIIHVDRERKAKELGN